GAARNAGVSASRAPLLFFLDDDIECFQDLVGAALELFSDQTLDAAGGANLTPPDSGALERATGGVMASWFGAASMRRRYRISKEGNEDEHGLILCNLAVRKALFLREKGFASHLISNEENVLLQRLTASGARLWTSPRLAVFHRRRATWAGLCSQAAKYGAGRAQNLLLAPESWKPLYLAPPLFSLYLISLPLLLWIEPRSVTLAPLLLYAAVAFTLSAARTVMERDPAQLAGLAVYPCVHFSYGLGFARAMLAWIGRRQELREHAA
ncbi:MAG: glycosyltransferase, partial [Bdellovibrionota bacterium]